MIERGISFKEIKDAIIKGRKRIQDGKIIATYIYFEVLYKKLNNTFYVITLKLR